MFKILSKLPLASVYEPALDSGYVPDTMIRMGIRALLGKKLDSLRYSSLEAQDEAKQAYLDSLRSKKTIAIHTKEANEQHYELPTEFFQLCLGNRMKYSSGLFENGAQTLEQAEEAMLDLYVQRAGIEDGMRILDLGCGWGSLSLYLAERFPASKVTGLSNSNSQREFILSKAKSLGLENLEIKTGDINTVQLDTEFDCILTIEMFEHMKNYESLLEKVSGWLAPETGRLFIHVFVHKDMPYDFKTEEDHSWMAKHFFTGGTMPSDDLFLWFQKDLQVVHRWIVNGQNYGQTSEEWLKRLDLNSEKALEILTHTYGSREEGSKWLQRWRIFYLSVAETFNYNQGTEWFVAHFLLRKK